MGAVGITMPMALAVTAVLLFGKVSAETEMTSTGYSVKQLPSPLSQLGEGPVWDNDTQSLYYIDILSASIHRYDYTENKTYNATIDDVAPISFIVLVDGQPGHYVMGAGTRLVLIRWDGRSEKGTFVRTLGDLGESERNVRFNDGKVDPNGRLYAGTMQTEGIAEGNAPIGKFYRFENGKFVEQKRNISISNGLTWDEPNNPSTMYYIDTLAYDVKVYQVAPNGDLRNETVLYDLRIDGKVRDYLADGMTSDADGMLYIATWGGSRVLKLNPRTLITEQEIAIPAEHVTSVAFGGPNLDELFVTTANRGKQPPAGALFKVTGLGVKGKPMYKMVL